MILIFTVPFFEDELEEKDDVRFDTEALNFSLQFNLFKNLETQLSFTNSNYENNYILSVFDLKDEENSYSSQIFNNIKDRSFSIANNWFINSEWSFDFGYDYNRKQVRFDIITVSVFEREIEDMNFDKGNFHNVFTSIQFKKDNWQLNSGIKANYYKEAASWDFSPRFNLQYSVTENLKWKFSAGILQQYISQLKEFGENDLGLNNQVWVLSETETETIQQAKKITSGLVYNNKGWLVDIEGYYHQTNGLSTLSPLFGTDITLPDFSPGSFHCQRGGYAP